MLCLRACNLAVFLVNFQRGNGEFSRPSSVLVLLRDGARMSGGGGREGEREREEEEEERESRDSGLGGRGGGGLLSPRGRT